MVSFDDRRRVPPQREGGRRVPAPRRPAEFAEDIVAGCGVPSCAEYRDDYGEEVWPFVRTWAPTKLPYQQVAPPLSNSQGLVANESPLRGLPDLRSMYGLRIVRPGGRRQPAPP